MTRIVSRLALATLGLLVATTALAQPRASGSADLNLPEIQTWTLDNGLQVAFMPVESAPVVAVQLWYHVGSKDEPRDRRGSAHMFEHMMFRGTANLRPNAHAQYLERLGGYVNAFTTEDATAYVDVVPARYLDFVLRLEAERMRNLLFRDDMIDTERKVVQEEIRQLENSPVSKGVRRFFELAYQTHPYAWTAAGTIEDLQATKAADLKKFYDAYYVPNNALLVVVGNATREAVEASVKEHFGGLAKGAAPPRPADAATEPAQKSKRRQVAEPGQIGIVAGGYHIPRAAHEDVYALQVLGLVLGAGESARLPQRLQVKDQIAVQAGAQTEIREHPGLFLVLAAYTPPATGAQVEAALTDEIAKVRNTPVSADELRKAKNQIRASFVFGLQDVSGLAQQIGSSWILTGDATQWVRDLAELEAVTAADVQRVAKKYLTDDNLSVVVVPPQGGQ